jgi:DNA-binding CsgD family transcriptional regulator
MMRRAVQTFGMDYFQLLRFKHRQFVDSPWSEMPAGLMPAAGKGGASGPDPMALKGLDAEAPYRWDETSGGGKGDEPLRHYREKARAAGIGAAFSIPLHGPHGVCDIVHIGGCDHLARAADHGPEAVTVMSAVAYLCSTRLRQIDRHAFGSGEPDVVLSARELEVLRWCKDGKSYSEIGTIIGISSKTVEFHIANVMRKLGVNQKIGAIIIAVRKGLIEI